MLSTWTITMKIARQNPMPPPKSLKLATSRRAPSHASTQHRHDHVRAWGTGRKDALLLSRMHVHSYSRMHQGMWIFQVHGVAVPTRQLPERTNACHIPVATVGISTRLSKRHRLVQQLPERIEDTRTTQSFLGTMLNRSWASPMPSRSRCVPSLAPSPVD